MTKYRELRTRQRLLPIAYCLLPIAFCLFLLGAAPERERLSVYAPQARYSLSVSTFDGREYVGLFELIEPLTTPELKVEGTGWKLRISTPGKQGRTAEAEFQEGSTIAKVRGKTVTLSAAARSENRRLMLPLHGIGSVLMPLLETDLIFHESARRMFLGGAAELVSPELRKGDPSTLTLHFPEAVSPNINSEGNSLKLSFTRDPVISFAENQSLNDKLFNSTSFIETDGAATLTITASAPLLAKFADDGHTIVISGAPAPPPATAPAEAASGGAAVQNVPVTAGPPASFPAMPTGVPAKPVSQPPTFLVVIDAAHGGSDSGARITPNLPEKDITLSLARKLRQELQSRHIANDMLRDNDNDLSLDQRAVLANLAHPAIFISLHAEPGSRLRIYTSTLPSGSEMTAQRNGFLLWESAQAAFASESSSLAAAVADSMEKRELTAQVRPAFVQPLHSIAAPAIAVEAPADNHGLRISEDLLAGAMAEAIAVRKLNVGARQ